MTNKRPSYKGFLTLVTCVTTLCILVLGMRVPDLSRPHRPKPKPRAYIEQQIKKNQPGQAKKCLEVEQPAVLPAVVAEIPLPAACRTPYATYPASAATRAVPPNNSRAPPA